MHRLLFLVHEKANRIFSSLVDKKKRIREQKQNKVTALNASSYKIKRHLFVIGGSKSITTIGTNLMEYTEI